ncbi:VanZ like family protein [Novipirellula galeiformis]|uniref:VanZ like family protein n=1 Tax=Novipirellula galeiformis TaxID=2528004 RepID=A0A5C6CCK5_9BACT|nr:VanZ family protein [Novipirellula galeiformis]TWU21201.1 VanZ like family protein [Novipirellula galeiformis]
MNELDRFPRPLDDGSPRVWLAVLGSLAAVALVYASIVPLEYRPLALDEAIERFRSLRWLNLNVDRRADWVANGLVALPFGFLLAGAADRDGRLTLRYLASLFAIILFGNTLIVGIEFLQLWYPRRTVSGNDIAAGCVAATISPLLWIAVGRPALAVWRRVRTLSWDASSSSRIATVLLWSFCSLLLVYSVLPLDVMFSQAEWAAKANAGRFAWVPGLHVVALDPQRGLLELAIALAVSSLRMVPLGILIVLARMQHRGLAIMLGFPILIELLQAPIFTRYTTLADVVCGWAGAAIGVVLATHWTAIQRITDRVSVRCASLLLVVLGIFVAFLARYERVANRAEIDAGWIDFWSPPFVKYYYTSEFLAGSNLVGKMILFAALGVALAHVFSRPGSRQQTPGVVASLTSILVVLGTGLTIEVAQVYLVPFYADASDVLIYAAGALGGWLSYRVVVTWAGGE